MDQQYKLNIGTYIKDFANNYFEPSSKKSKGRFVLIFDVRSPLAFFEAHLFGAINLHPPEGNPQETALVSEEELVKLLESPGFDWLFSGLLLQHSDVVVYDEITLSEHLTLPKRFYAPNDLQFSKVRKALSYETSCVKMRPIQAFVNIFTRLYLTSSFSGVRSFKILFGGFSSVIRYAPVLVNHSLRPLAADTPNILAAGTRTTAGQRQSRLCINSYVGYAPSLAPSPMALSRSCKIILLNVPHSKLLESFQTDPECKSNVSCHVFVLANRDEYRNTLSPATIGIPETLEEFRSILEYCHSMWTHYDDVSLTPISIPTLAMVPNSPLGMFGTETVQITDNLRKISNNLVSIREVTPPPWDAAFMIYIGYHLFYGTATLSNVLLQHREVTEKEFMVPRKREQWDLLLGLESAEQLGIVASDYSTAPTNPLYNSIPPSAIHSIVNSTAKLSELASNLLPVVPIPKPEPVKDQKNGPSKGWFSWF